MGLRQRLAGALTRYMAIPPALPSYDNFWPYANLGNYSYPLSLNQTMPGSKGEVIDQSFAGYASAYKANGIVFACMLARLSIFSEARFQFRHMTNGRPGDLFGTAALKILEHPYGPQSTTGDLLARMIQDADIGGNSFHVRRGQYLRRMRPDWVTIVLGSESDPEVDNRDFEAEVLGYIYYPGGRLATGKEPVVLLRDEVAHFAPIPDPEASYRGMSWLTPIVREITADTAATDHKLRFFENGATPNMVVTLDKDITLQAFSDWVDKFKGRESKGLNAYQTLYLAAGATATVVGKDLQQLDFKVTQGAGETRIAAAAGIHPVVVGLSEGMQGSSLNAGNFNSARRLTADKTFRPLWRNAAGSLEHLIKPPNGASLWYDDRDVSFLREDRKDAAEIFQISMTAAEVGIRAGWKADDVIKAVEAEDMGLLIGKHTGLFSVQLQAPGSTKMPGGEAPGESPVGDGTAPEASPSTKPTNGTKPVIPAKQP